MQLYRLDSPSGPIRDLLGPVLYRNRVTARARGIQAASELSEPVTLTTITRNGRLRADLRIDPNGRCARLTY